MSLTCICCKTLEHILVSNINKHLALDSILADCQHGFRSQRSCETQLVQFVQEIISNLDGAVNRGHKQTDLLSDFINLTQVHNFTVSEQDIFTFRRLSVFTVSFTGILQVLMQIMKRFALYH